MESKNGDRTRIESPDVTHYMALRNSSNIVDGILQDFPGPVVLSARPARWLTYTILGAVMFFTSLFVVAMVLSPELIEAAMHKPVQRAASGAEMLMTSVAGVVGAAMGALTICLSISRLWPRRDTMRLDAEGFEFKERFQMRRVAWRAASGFRVVRPGSGWSMIVFDDEGKPKVRPRWYDRGNSSNSYLFDSYGLPTALLANVMTRWRARALTHAKRTRNT